MEDSAETTVNENPVLALAITLKGEGNALFKQGNYLDAVKQYNEASLAIPTADPTIYQDQDYKKLKISLLTNSALCLSKIPHNELVEQQCREGLKEFPNSLKLKYYLGIALCEQGKHQHALPLLRQVLNSQPENAEARKRIEECLALTKEHHRALKHMFWGQLAPKKARTGVTVSWGALAVGALAGLGVGYLFYRSFK